MKRRHLLQAVITLPATPLLKAQESSSKPPAAAPDEPQKLDYAAPDAAGEAVSPKFFSASQYAVLEKLCNVIAPASGATPGALAAGVPSFLDFLIGRSPAERQSLYRDGLDRLASQGFEKASPADVETLLAPLRTPWKRDGGVGVERFLRAAKDDILEATMNSREWIAAASKQNRNARGLGSYWRVIE